MDDLSSKIEELSKAINELYEDMMKTNQDSSTINVNASSQNQPLTSSSINKEEKVSYDKNGQWKIEKKDDPRKIALNEAKAHIMLAQEKKLHGMEHSHHLRNAKESVQRAKDIHSKMSEQTKTMPNVLKFPDKKAACENLVVKEDEVEKSGYIGYTPEDNARRKASNIGDVPWDAMPHIKSSGKAGPKPVEQEANKMRSLSAKQPVTVYSPKKIKALVEKQKKKKKQ